MKIGTPGPVSFPKDHQFGLLLIRNSGRAGRGRNPLLKLQHDIFIMITPIASSKLDHV